MTQPLRNNWLTDPLAIDSAFQLLILWSTAHRRARSLPVSLESFRQYRAWPGEGVTIAVRVLRSTGRSAVSDIEFVDRQNGEIVAAIEGYECVLDPSLESAFRLNRLSDGAIA
jgi:acyl-coenzyme A thioesterase PaaI-like protein